MRPEYHGIIITRTLFQSTHPRGVRPLFWLRLMLLTLFQSTHPRGVRLKIMYASKPVKSFNPRTHEGCDHWHILLFHNSSVSIHAPTRGTTKLSKLVMMVLHVSIHAPTRGATCPGNFSQCRYDVSIHAPTRGATNLQLASGLIMFVSIHAPTRGATLCC